MAAKKILIVEDDAFLRELCSKKLEKSGYDIILATDGNEALKKIKEEQPDLVLLDIILPGIEGFEVLRRVRELKDEIVSKTRIVMLSNLGQKSDIDKAKRLGATDYIVKAHYTTDDIYEKTKDILGE